ncbi:MULTISPECIES: GtrA family protein [Pseudomonas]|uniref:GtrA family protein n=1 Tax=Pseudomonas azadiae TaxID=2843612 RepID=A0ABS6P192_9PSED|nr:MULTISPECIES: GtrA family protein [Pseudomonas]MBV4454235.1 GtrA family protein [Pseudomonas azadiae]NMF40197.1 GtrA family protein [Pseudomonas sp. SWRI 103]
MQKKLRLFIRYLGAGVIATLVHFVVFVCLLPYYGPTSSTLCAAVTGAMVAFCLSRHWVFAQRNCNSWRFLITATSQVLSNTLIVNLLTHWGAPALIAQIVATAAVTLQGVTINHLWVFKHDIKRAPLR